MSPEASDSHIQKLKNTRVRLKSGEYDGVDIMTAWLAIDELVAALSEGEELREGMVLVPVEPNETQKAIGAQTLHGYGFEGHLVNAAGAAYRAMIAARKGREEA